MDIRKTIVKSRPARYISEHWPRFSRAFMRRQLARKIRLEAGRTPNLAGNINYIDKVVQTPYDYSLLCVYSLFNPVLRASQDDKKIANPNLTVKQREKITAAKNINNSDIDFCEFKGRLIINYSWGNQQGTEFLAQAVYEGTLEEFLSGWFRN